MEGVVYLPSYPEIDNVAVDRMSAAVNSREK